MKNENMTFIEGATYQLHCQTGAIAKRTMTFVRWLNKEEALLKIGSKSRPIKIVLGRDGSQYTQFPTWCNGASGNFAKYENVSAKNDRIG